MTVRDIEVAVTSLGAGGDGIAETEDGRVYVPYSAPGDRLVVSLPNSRSTPLRGKIVKQLKDGPGRQDPLCPHFTSCGGCAVQHLAASSYSGWKQGIVRDALSHRGLDPTVVDELVPGSIGRRRRARFHARMTAKGPILGYLASRSSRIVPVSECPVLVPAITAFLGPLRALLVTSLGRGQQAEVAVTACDVGLDVVFVMGKSLSRPLREKLVAFAEANDLVRVGWQPSRRDQTGEPEIVLQRRPATVTFGGIQVDLPPDGFIQPTAEGEAALREAVLAAIAGARRAVDLYAGCGAFSLPVAASGCHVMAVDSAADQLTALDNAARRARLGEFVSTDRRDLNRRPLLGEDLKNIDAVILDPPRAGALVQAGFLAESQVPVVVYVSCNPASFARDVRVLADGGYALRSVTPVDQFLFSPHTELVSVLRKLT